MVRMWVSRVGGLIVMALTGALAAANWHGDAAAWSSSDRVVSPSTVAAYLGHPGEDGVTELVLMVLWRGSPSWYKRGGAHSSSGGGGSSSAAQTITYAGRTLSITINT